MELRTSSKNQKEKKGRPLPKRGQVKAKIFSMLVRLLVPKGLKKNKGDEFKECEQASTPSNPAVRIEWCVHYSGDKQLLLWKGLVKADGSSAGAPLEKGGGAN